MFVPVLVLTLLTVSLTYLSQNLRYTMSGGGLRGSVNVSRSLEVEEGGISSGGSTVRRVLYNFPASPLFNLLRGSGPGTVAGDERQNSSTETKAQATSSRRLIHCGLLSI